MTKSRPPSKKSLHSVLLGALVDPRNNPTPMVRAVLEVSAVDPDYLERKVHEELVMRRHCHKDMEMLKRTGQSRQTLLDCITLLALAIALEDEARRQSRDPKE